MKKVLAHSLLILLPILSFGGVANAQMQHIAEKLGYPPDSKLLIIHADDLGVAHSQDMASFKALEERAVTAASVMVPCPWFTEVADFAKLHPDMDIGLHLTLTSEWKTYRWGPVAPRDQVASLLDPNGYFYRDNGPVAARARPEEAELEVRAQVQRALAMGIRPSHLDIHMGTLAATPQLYSVLIKVAHELHLPYMAVKLPGRQGEEMLKLVSPNDIVLDHLVMFTPPVPADRWTENYLKAIESLKPGLTEMIVHLAYDNSEMRAITVDHPDYGAAWRQRDFNAVTSPEFKQALKENHIILVGWKQLDRLVQK
ncbi:MAG: ChbG/HpnK family deacetylase [Acidobacteria bacterium]|nr:MAG: ChbG/HpnK family deacetylase [Acidobacteriota bacterium]